MSDKAVKFSNGNSIETIPPKESKRSPRGQRYKAALDDPWYTGEENDIYAEDILDSFNLDDMSEGEILDLVDKILNHEI